MTPTERKGTYGMGRVYKRGNAFWLGYWVNGAERRESVAKILGKPVGAVTAREAERALRLRLDARSQGKLIAPRHERATVAELLTDYERHLEVTKPESVAGLRAQVRAVRDWLGDRVVSRLDLPVLEAAAREREGIGWARGTIKTRLALLHAACVYWKRAGRLASVPDMPVLHVDNARQGFFEDAEVEALLKHLPAPVDDIVRALAATGWRLSEILGLQWAQVDLRQMELRLEESKTGKGARPLLEGEPLHEVLKRRYRERGLGVPWVFWRPIGTLGRVGRVQTTWFRQRWVRGCAAAGLVGKIPHDFRRSAYRNLVMAGNDLVTAMHLTRHKSLSIAIRYNIQEPGRQRAGLARLLDYQRAQSEQEASHAKPR